MNLSPTQRFWRCWAASTVSGTGTGVTAVALPLIAVVVLQASAFEVGLLTAATYAAWLVLGLPAGVIAARLPLRGLQVAADLVRALALLSVPAAWALGSLTLAHLPSVVPAEQRTARNSLMSATHAVTGVGGPTVGGVLVQLVGAVPTLLLDAVSYLVSAALLRSLPAVPAVAPDGPAPRVLAQIGEGWRYVVRHPVIGRCMWGATVINVVSGALLTLTPLYLVRTLGAPPALVGLLIATDGLGALVGASITPRLVRRLGSARALRWVSVAGLVLAVLLPVGSGGGAMVAFAVGNAGLAAAVVVFSIVTRTYRQNVPPPGMLSRVMATVRFVSWGAIPLGALAAGALAGATSPRTALWVAVAVLAAWVVATWGGALRRVRDLEDVVVDASA